MRLITKEKGKPKNFGESGQGLVVAVLAMGVLLGMVAMAVDVGLYLHERRQLQNAADAAALAGAFELPRDPGLGIAKARDWAANNGIDLVTELEDVHVESCFLPSFPAKDDGGLDDFGVMDNGDGLDHFPVMNDAMVVTVRRDVDFFFARVLGIEGGTVGATAKACKGSPIGTNALAPWAVLESVFLNLEPGDRLEMKFSASNPQTGNFLPLALDQPGANEYKDNIIYGSEQSLCARGYEMPDCPSRAVTQPGNVVGPTRTAVQWMQQNTSAACDDFRELFGQTEGGEWFLNPDCNGFTAEGVASYLVVVVPIIDRLSFGACSQQMSQSNVSCGVNVISFALVLINGVNCSGRGQGLCTVTAHYAKANVDTGALIGPYDPQGSITFVRLVE